MSWKKLTVYLQHRITGVEKRKLSVTGNSARRNAGKINLVGGKKEDEGFEGMETVLSPPKQNNMRPSRTAERRKKPNVRVLSSPRYFLHLISFTSFPSCPSVFSFFTDFSLPSFRCCFSDVCFFLSLFLYFYIRVTVSGILFVPPRRGCSFMRMQWSQEYCINHYRLFQNVYLVSTTKMEWIWMGPLKWPWNLVLVILNTPTSFRVSYTRYLISERFAVHPICSKIYRF